MDALILLIVFIAAVLLVFAAYVALNRRRLTEAVEARQRLRALRGGGRTSVDIMRDQRRSSMPLFDAVLHDLPLVARLEQALTEANLPWSVGEYLLGSALLVVVGVAAGQWGGGGVGAAAILVAAAAPPAIVAHRRRRRVARLEAQLPEAIDMIVNAIRAGFSLPAAIQFVGEELAAPMGTEFHRLAEEQRLGMDLREALIGFEARVGSIDAKLFVTAILVQRESGGTLSEVLLGLAGVVRERAALRERVATLTAEPRASARVLGLLPIVCFVLLFVLDPAFVRPMLTTTLGHLLLAYAALSVTVGYLLLSRFARIEF
jgi:tight adherence protein B